MMPDILDCTTFSTITVAQLWERFKSEADDVELPHSLALHILDEALGGDACAQDLIETTCSVKFA